jgi:cytochrome c biogenesis protein CcmG/thiol:disulfide interchange protein DsbE
MEAEVSAEVKRNTVVLGVVLFILATFAWAGWANFEYRQQAAQLRLASVERGMLVADPQGGPPEYVSPLKGNAAPAFALEDVTGKKVSLASFKGKAVLINFWATWCAPCKVETPWLVELRNQYGPQGFEVLGISADDLDRNDTKKFSEEKDEIAQFATKMQIPYPVLIDGTTLSDAYGGLDELPMSFYVDRNGVVVAVQMGLTSKSEIEANVKKAMGQ